MRVVVQRVKSAKCLVEGKVIGAINNGLLLLVGFTHADGYEQVKQMVRKIVNLRIFEDENHKMNKSIIDIDGEILSISQFTLYANPYNGNRPSFTDAMYPKVAIELYKAFNKSFTEDFQIKTQTGEFGADMQLEVICDGPVTINLEYSEVRQ